MKHGLNKAEEIRELEDRNALQATFIQQLKDAITDGHGLDHTVEESCDLARNHTRKLRIQEIKDHTEPSHTSSSAP